MTTLPRSKDEVAEGIDETQRFLSGDPAANRMLFVLDANGSVDGVSAIIPKLGKDRPFYSFKRSKYACRSRSPSLSTTHDTLNLVTDFDGHTELASLFVAPAARGGGRGRLLSLGRLAFIASHPSLFETRLMADIRGWVDEQGQSPFWNGLASNFVDLDFDAADRLSAQDGRFIAELFPLVPILLNLLPSDVVACVSRPHEASVGALKLLHSIGFETTEMCDVFDGGPGLACGTENTLIAKSMKTAIRFSETDEALDPLLHFFGTGKDFAAVIAPGNSGFAAASKVAVQTLSTQPALDQIRLAETGRRRSKQIRDSNSWQ